jgi:hypothetical protein
MVVAEDSAEPLMAHDLASRSTYAPCCFYELITEPLMISFLVVIAHRRRSFSLAPRI